MGFYPLDPVSGQYLIVVPTFNQVKIKLPNQGIFEILKCQKTAKSSYIKSIKLNGKPYLKTFIKHSDLMNGGKLEFYLEDKPSNWGVGENNQPGGLKLEPF